MEICQYKHTKYQPTDEEWKCPKCGASYDENEEFIIWDAVGENCSLLHDEDRMDTGIDTPNNKNYEDAKKNCIKEMEKAL